MSNEKGKGNVLPLKYSEEKTLQSKIIRVYISSDKLLCIFYKYISGSSKGL